MPFGEEIDTLNWFDLAERVFSLISYVSSNMITSISKLFFNPSRWYLHSYLDGFGIDLTTKGTAFSITGFFSFPIIEQIYIIFGIGLPVVIFITFFRYIYKFFHNQGGQPKVIIFLCLWYFKIYFIRKWNFYSSKSKSA